MLENVLEQIKQKGNYSVHLFYGEDVGCDDIEVPKNERNILILASPIGHLGGIRTMIKTNLNELKDFDINELEYVKVSNPPDSSEVRNNGAYIWGSDDRVEKFLNNNIK